jgi:hydroxyacylglutathione hydrolase
MVFDHVLGIVLAADVVCAHQALLVKTEVTTFADLPALLSRGGAAVQLLDVRKASEFAAGHLRGAMNLAHTRLRPRLAEVAADRPWIVSCQSGMRATGACAYLERAGRTVACVVDAFERAPSELRA